MYVATDIDGFNSVGTRNAVIRAHRQVMAAIREGDADAAARRMDRHVSAYITDVHSSQKSLNGNAPKET